MKYRWLKINGSMIWGTNNLVVADLARLKQGGYDCILDIQEGTYYDADANDWLKFEGDKE